MEGGMRILRIALESRAGRWMVQYAYFLYKTFIHRPKE